MDIRRFIFLFLGLVFLISGMDLVVRSFYTGFFIFGNSSEKPKVVLFYLDGADWYVINKMINGGMLPNFRYIMEHGYIGKITTPFNSDNPGNPADTTEMVTGVYRTKNGVRGWNVIDINGNEREVQSIDWKYPSLWEILSDKGYTVGVYGWWATWPPKRLNGFIYNTELLPYDAECCYPGWIDDDIPPETHEVDKAWTGLARYINKTGKIPDFLAISFHRIDIAQHMMWIAVRPGDFKQYFNLSNDFSKKYGIDSRDGFIAREYELVDDFIGKIISLYSNMTNNFYVIVTSDHGFESVLPTGQTDLYGFLKDMGLMKYKTIIDHWGRYKYIIEPGTKIYRCMPLLPRTNSNAHYIKYDEKTGKMIYQILDEDFCIYDKTANITKIIEFLSNIKYECSGLPLFINLTYNKTLDRIMGERIVDFRCLGQPKIKYDIVDDASAKGYFYFMTLPSTLILPNGSKYEFHLGPLKTGCHPPKEVYGIFIAYSPKYKHTTKDIGVIKTVDIAPTLLNIYGIKCSYCDGERIDITK